MNFIEMADNSIICDLRQLNHRPIYDDFFEAATKYIVEQIETSVDERPHDQIVHLEQTISARDLLK